MRDKNIQMWYEVSPPHFLTSYFYSQMTRENILNRLRYIVENYGKGFDSGIRDRQAIKGLLDDMESSQVGDPLPATLKSSSPIAWVISYSYYVSVKVGVKHGMDLSLCSDLLEGWGCVITQGPQGLSEPVLLNYIPLYTKEEVTKWEGLLE